MYLYWILNIVAILIIVFLLYNIYKLAQTYSSAEGFQLTYTPPERYNIPQIKGVTGRYVRIGASQDTNADGYLTISQIEVIDINGKNIALNKKVTATSYGGSPVDQQYGKQTLIGNVYQYSFSKSNVPSSIVDGITVPRRSLQNVFETSIRTTSEQPQYVEIDLGDNYIINSVIYTGRADAETATFSDPYGNTVYLTQVDRQKGMRLTIRDSSNVATLSTTFNNTSSKQTINIDSSFYTINPNSSSLPTTTVDVPDINSYKTLVKPYVDLFETKGNLVDEHKNVIKAVRSLFADSVAIDISNNIFLPSLLDSPITFYYDFYKKAGCPYTANCRTQINTTGLGEQERQQFTNALVASCNLREKYCLSNTLTIKNIPVNIFGTASPNAIAEMRQSIKYCELLYVGNPPSIENYIRLHFSFSDIKNGTDPVAYLRGNPVVSSGGTSTANSGTNTANNPILNNSTPHFCLPDINQIFRGGTFITSLISQNQSSNALNCTLRITPTVLSLIPVPSRNIVISWIYNRTVRYKRFMNLLSKNLEIAIKDRDDAKKEMDKAMQALTNAMKTDNLTPLEIGLSAASLGVGLIAIITAKSVIAGIALQNAVNVYNTAKDNVSALQSQEHQVLNIKETATYLSVPSNINIYVSSTVDRIAQQMYEMLGGNYNITYVYDIFQLGSTMLDIRFDLYVHNDVSSLIGPINDLKAQYSSIKMANKQTKDVLDQAAADYETELSNLENISIKAISKPFKGVVGRLFYTTENRNSITITGIILDDRAVTSFLPELNGGIPTSLGPIPGNINYAPKILFTKNRPESLDFTKKDTLRRVFDDYIRLVNDSKNNYPLMRANPSLDVKRGQLVINNVLGIVVESPLSCKLTWTESLYSPDTNVPIDPTEGSSNRGSNTVVTRTATFTYKQDITIWYSSELQITMDGIKFLSSNEGSRLSAPIVFTKPLPEKTTLYNMSNLCPDASCDDPDILYSLVDQYNSDPTLAGTILTVTHAFTPNKYQCDIKASINYDSNIKDIIGIDTIDTSTGLTKKRYDTIRKGSVKYDINAEGGITKTPKPMPHSGLKKDITMALYVALDKTSCKYNLIDASGLNTGTSIQENTPSLFTPMIYTKELKKEATAGSDIEINSLTRDTVRLATSTSNLLGSYRTDTRNTFESIKAGRNDISLPTNADFTAIQNEINARIMLGKDAATTAGFTDYSVNAHIESEAVEKLSFDMDDKRNSYLNAKDTQFELPLNQKEDDPKPRNTPPSYKFIRLSPIQTRDENAVAVNLGKITFFYKGVPLFLKGTVSNPMGTWEGTMADITGPGARSGWSDAHKKPILFAFHNSIAIDAYSLTTALPETEAAGDPVSWKLEGSQNGTFWTLLDTRRNFPTPLRRFTETNKLYFTGQGRAKPLT